MKTAFYFAIGLIHWLYDMLMPRFVTEQLALTYCEEDGEYEVYGQLWLCDESDDIDAICTCKCFNFFGFALFPSYSEIEDL